MEDISTTFSERSWRTAGPVRGGVKPASASHAQLERAVQTGSAVEVVLRWGHEPLRPLERRDQPGGRFPGAKTMIGSTPKGSTSDGNCTNPPIHPGA